MTDSVSRSVYFVSESTGITAEAYGQSLLSQFGDARFIKRYTPFINTRDKAQALANELAHRAEAEGKKPIDRFPRAGLAGERSHAVAQIEVEAADDNQIANRDAAQHRSVLRQFAPAELGPKDIEVIVSDRVQQAYAGAVAVDP